MSKFVCESWRIMKHGANPLPVVLRSAVDPPGTRPCRRAGNRMHAAASSNQKPETRDQKPETINPKRATRNQKLGTPPHDSPIPRPSIPRSPHWHSRRFSLSLSLSLSLRTERVTKNDLLDSSTTGPHPSLGPFVRFALSGPDCRSKVPFLSQYILQGDHIC